MRTTLTLDDDLAAQIREMVRESGKSFKAIINELLRKAIASDRAGPIAQPFDFEPASLGEVIGPYNLDKATQLAADLEDQELIRKMELRK